MQGTASGGSANVYRTWVCPGGYLTSHENAVLGSASRADGMQTVSE